MKKVVEFDVLVTHNIRIRSPSQFILFQEVTVK